MHYVYVLKSRKDNKLYIGRTQDIKRRITEHNNGLNISTQHRRPFELVYCEIYKSRQDAIERESKIKKFKNSYTELKKRIKRSID